MKAMILSAGAGTRLLPLTLTIPKPMLPVANIPALEHIVGLCKKHNITKIKMNLFYLPECIDKYFKDGKQFGVDISYSIEKKLQGTAGGIKRIQSFFDETFIVLSGDGYTDIDISAMLKFHKNSGSKATIAVKEVEDPSKFGVVVTDSNFKITSFQEKPKKEEALSKLVNLGIYIFEPEILDLIPPKEEYDFGFQLFPKLLREKIPFYAFSTNCKWSDIGSLEEYWKVNLDSANSFDSSDGQYLNPKEGVFIHNTSKIDNTVLNTINGNVVIGENCNIKATAKLSGNVIIGNEVFIDDNAFINNSVILNNTYVGKDVEIKDSVVNQNYHLSVPNNFGTFIDDDKVLRSHYIIPFKTKFNVFLINATDRIVAFFALLFLSPLFLVTAILIKLDSKGPVFYISKRLRSPEIEKKGIHWYVFFKEKPVKYYVFRTMYTDADKRIAQLKNKYDTGPYVKIEDDPRITKIGKILRKTSIDELPLFWNVFKGNMSLVGIWALPSYEARHLHEKGLISELEDTSIDLTEVAQVRFKGKPGIAGFWQARGRSNLTAEERALHDTVQSVMENITDKDKDYLGEYTEFNSYKGYLKMLFETFKSVIKRTGAE
jgi:NDP-sugar pyrophosphorylase family protein/lipopolysaccharide/colanic/teichoic acid biosynthesis glycosyltransferase